MNRDARDTPADVHTPDDSLRAKLLPAIEQFESALARGEYPSPENFVAGWEEPQRQALHRELLMVEAQHRQRDDRQAPKNAAAEVPCPHCQSPVPIQFEHDDHVCPACGGAFQLDPYSTKPWQADRARLGKFELLEEVGRGGFGKVYKAHDAELHRIVAVKVPRGGQLATPEDEDRFVREARAAAQLHHPGIVQVYEVGRGADYPYIVSEFVHGVTLNDALTARRFTFRQSAELIAQIADALDHAHRKGVVHRDLKPSNVMLERVEAHETEDGKSSDTGRPSDSGRSSGSSRTASTARPRVSELDVRPRIMDFGLARRDDGEVTVTMDGQVLGTPAYMSPEQARGEGHHVERTSDVYSLGVILFELLTGELPFRGNKQMLIHQAIHDDPQPPRKLNNRIPRDLETICLKCLHKEPRRRYAAARELADDLRRFLEYEPILARPVGRVERSMRWLRRHPAAIWTATLLLVLTAAGVLGEHIWRQKREADAAAQAAAESQVEKIEYFMQLSRRRGELVGIGPTTEGEAHILPHAYRFLRKGGVVQRVELINGILPDEDQGTLSSLLGLPRRYIVDHVEATCKSTRDSGGAVVKEEAFDPYGQLLWTLEYATAGKAAFLDYRGNDELVNLHSSRLLFRITWDNHGWLRDIHFEDEAGRPQSCSNGSWGLRLNHTAEGLLQRVEYLDRNGQTLKSESTPSGWTCEYDHQARLVERSYLDERGQRSEWNGVHRVIISYSGEGHEKTYLDLAGQPPGVLVGAAGSGLALTPIEHKQRWKYANNGRTLVLEQVHVAQGRVEDKPDSMRFQFNDRRDLVEIEWLDGEGQPRFDEHNECARYRQFVDESGNIREKVYERRNHTGDWVARKRLNSAGKVLEEAHFTDDGHPKLDNEGVHRYSYEYDSRQNCISGTYFGTDGLPVGRARSGIHRFVSKFDERGREIEARFFGPDDRPVVSADGGSHVWRRKYDAVGNQTEESHYGLDGKLITTTWGWARWEKSYDPKGQLLERSEWLVDRGGKLVLKKREDGKGNWLEAATFTANGEPTEWKPGLGFHRQRNEFDSQGNFLSTRFFDAKDQPIVDTDLRIHGWTKKYDPAGREIEGTYVDPQGEPIASTEGFHRWFIRRDARGNSVEVSHFDVSNRPVLKKPIGVHRWVDTYDEHDRAIEGRMYGVDGKPIQASWGGARWTSTYDEQGTRVEYRIWIVDKHGAYLPWRTTDEHDRLIEETVFVRKRPDDFTATEYRVHRHQYDVNGRCIDTRAFDPQDRPALLWETGAHRITSEYDSLGRVVESNHFDFNGKPANTKLGYHRVTYAYDPDGNIVDTKWFSEDGTPVPVKE